MSVKAILAGQGSGGTETFEAIYGTTTSAEIETAYQKGQDVVCKYNGSVYQLISRASSTSHTFGVMTNSSGTLTDSNLICLADVWSTSSVSVTPTLYLPKTGGRMTGDLIMENQGSDWSDPPKFMMTGNNDHHAGIKLTDDGTNVDFGWEYTNSDGAGLGLASVEHSSRPGVFNLYAKNSNSEIALVGKPDGSLTWAGREVVADDYYVRPNLLDNAYFVGGGSQQGGGQFPINQRGQTRYTTEGYTIDRWRTWDNVTLEIASDGIVLSNSGDTNGLFHYLENWEVAEGTPVTLSALFAGNQLITATAVSASQINIVTPWLEDGVYANFYRDTNTTHVSIRLVNGASAKVRAVKLELGSTQTLAHQDENGNWVLNEIPNYTEQLLRCSRGEQIDEADSGATLPLYRQEAFVSSDTVPAINGAINWTYV